MFVGLTMLVLFLFSDIVDSPSFNLLVGGVVLLAFGIYLWFRDPPEPPEPSERFRTMRSFGKKKPPAKK
jgi:hypothetical protein